MKTDVETFFNLFLEELRGQPEMTSYYKFLNDEKRFYFRKNYFCRRLEYVARHAGPQEGLIWDCGCGYGTTAIFLTLNGYSVYGTTLEFYFEQISRRIQYWSKFGDLSGFTYSYQDLFDMKDTKSVYDRIIVQDTLHHLEPINEALRILYNRLAPQGKLIVIEENGENLFQRTKNFFHRGNKRIIEVYDEKLKKKVLIGNENIRSVEVWEKLLNAQNFYIDDYEYIRYFLPFQWKEKKYEVLVAKEKDIWKRNKILRRYFFLGVNFVASK